MQGKGCCDFFSALWTNNNTIRNIFSQQREEYGQIDEIPNRQSPVLELEKRFGKHSSRFVAVGKGGILESLRYKLSYR